MNFWIGLNETCPIEPGRMFPGCAKRLQPPAISISSGIQFPPAINGPSHSIAATLGRDCAVSRLLADRGKTFGQGTDQFFGPRRNAKRLGDTADIVPNIIEVVWLERDHRRLHPRPRAKRLLQITRRDCADRALRLGQNQIRPQLAQAIDVDSINREALGHDFFHALIDLVGGSVDWNFRGAANRQRFDTRRKVAFVGAAYEMIGEAERSDDLGRARQQGDNTRRIRHCVTTT